MPDNRPRIAVVGSINRDTIRTPDGLTTESYGGLLYSILSLHEILDGQVEIFPVCKVGLDVKEIVADILGSCRSVHFDGVLFVPGKNNHCFLDYDEKGRKQETLKDVVPPLTINNLYPFLSCDAVCFNFITGREMTLETCQLARASTGSPVLMDLHSLTLGIDPNGRRFWRKPPDWEAWVACGDVIQMNREEASLIWGRDILLEGELRRFGNHVLENGPTALIVTLGDGGSRAVFRTEKGTIESIGTEAPLPEPSVDETGCGDVFLMGFTAAYIRSLDVRRASDLANRAAAANCCLRGIEEIGRLREYLC